MRRAWVMNLDADDELARFPSPYQRPQNVEAHIASRAPRALLGADDIVLQNASLLDGDYECAAWCPTALAISTWERHGLRGPRVPTMETLRRVNHRAFALPFCDAGLQSHFIADEAAWTDWLHRQDAGPWLFKRPFGYVGRGQRRASVPLSEDDHKWVIASLKSGDGLVVERYVEIVREFALHGIIANGQCSWGQLTEQVVDAQRVWRESRLSADVALGRRMRGACEPLLAQLVSASYWGPFGVDAYAWKNDRGQLQMNFVSELNARYTMGFAVGMATPLP